jgi:hypothetical protein
MKQGSAMRRRLEDKGGTGEGGGLRWKTEEDLGEQVVIFHISTSRFDVILLIFCGRLNHGYCLSVLCMFVIGILSLFCGEVILSDCFVSHMLLIKIMFDTCE